MTRRDNDRGSWQVIATLVVIVFALLVLQAALAEPYVEIQSSLNATGDYSNEHFDGNELITDWISDWFNMGLIAVFGLAVWATARVLRRELTRERL